MFVMDRCTNSRSRWIRIILFILFTSEVVECHRVQLCRETVKCLEDEKIRLDRFVNSSHPIELEELRLECNRKVICVRDELQCDYRQDTGIMLEYSCIKDLPFYDGAYPLKSGTILSRDYPNSVVDEFRTRLVFTKNVTLKLRFHDIGTVSRTLLLTVYSFQGKNWTKYSRYVGLNSLKSFHNAKIFDISMHAKRAWITFTIEDIEKPAVTIKQCPNGELSSSDCPPQQEPPQQEPPQQEPPQQEPPQQKTPTKPVQNSKSWVLYTVIISVLSTIILVIIIAFVWKRFSSIQCYLKRQEKYPEQRPDILTHFPSDGNIITGDILAHEIESAAAEEEAAAAAAAEAEADGNRNITEEDTTIYETIAVPHYTDFPQRPRPSLPELPTLPGLASYIEVLPRIPEKKRNL